MMEGESTTKTKVAYVGQLPYYHRADGPCGSVMSIDNLVIEYRVPAYTKKGQENVRRQLMRIYYENVDGFNEFGPKSGMFYRSNPQQHGYQWFAHVWQGDGVNTQFMKFGARGQSVPMLRLEFNPNKHWDKPVASALRRWITENCACGVLRKYDFALDLPVPIEAVHITSRKHTGVKETTRYYGQRGKHGQLKVYDKAKEYAAEHRKQQLVLAGSMTRLEWTWECSDDTGVQFDTFSVPSGLTLDVPPPRLRAFVHALTTIKLQLGDYEYQQHLKDLDVRTRQKIRPYVEGVYIEPNLAAADVEKLLAMYSDELNIAYAVEAGKWHNWQPYDACCCDDGGKQ